MTHTCSPSPVRPNGIAVGKALLASLGLILLALATRPAHGQVSLTETTWGRTGAEVATAVATAADGSAYLVGSTNSFALDQFGQPATRMFVVKLSNGAVVWQRIWNGPTIVGVTDASVAVAAHGSIHVAGITANGGGDAVLLKFDPKEHLLGSGPGAVPSPIAPARWRRTATAPSTPPAGQPASARAPPGCSS